VVLAHPESASRSTAVRAYDAPNQRYAISKLLNHARLTLWPIVGSHSYKIQPVASLGIKKRGSLYQNARQMWSLLDALLRRAMYTCTSATGPAWRQNRCCLGVSQKLINVRYLYLCDSILSIPISYTKTKQTWTQPTPQPWSALFACSRT